MSCTPTITGLGLVTPLGHSASETWDSLLAGRFIRTDHAKLSLPDAPPAPRVTQLARRAAAEAVRQAGWTAADLASPTTTLIVGTSKGPVESWLEAPHVHVGLPLGLSELAVGVAASLGFGTGPRLTLSAACASGLHALVRATMLIRSGECDRALVVGAEASVHPLFLGSFRRLGVLPPDGFGCRPFDENRTGFLMSDAAAAICLERGATGEVLGHIDGYANGADATHITGSDPSGRLLRDQLRRVIAGGPVDLIHAHGTGTIANDAMELNAIESVIAESARPVLYSHKGALGHSLGAAGMVSVVLNCLAMQEGVVPGNVRLENPLPARNVILSSQRIERPIRRCIAMAAGFGGPTAVVSLTNGHDMPSQRSASWTS